MAPNICIEKCDMFDFMAHFVGVSVLHPGGLVATRKLAEACHIDQQSKVVDIACGKGTTAVYLAEKYGCSVVGIDISEELIEEAHKNVQRKGLAHRVTFLKADAANLPFEDNQFDVAISQAMLVLIDDRKKVIQEAMRVIKPPGSAGWLELSWNKEPPREFLDTLANKVCAYCMLNVRTYEGWAKLFEEAGVQQLDIVRFAENPKAGMGSMIADEGLINSLKIMLKSISNSQIRRRMNLLDKFLSSNRDFFGYGIYVAAK